MHHCAARRPLRRLSLALLAACASGLIEGCATPGDAGKLPAALADLMPNTRLVAEVPLNKVNTTSRQIAMEGLVALDAKDYRRASEFFNLAVKTDMTNSYLHLLNAVAYQMRAITGESSLLPLAEQGFQAAVQFDSSNWLARYYAGHLAMGQRDYAQAQKCFLAAGLYAGERAELLYDLAVASYNNHDPRTAAAALEGLRRLSPVAATQPNALRAAVLVHAALDERDEAQASLAQLRTTSTDSFETSLVEARAAAWNDAWSRARMVKTAGFAKKADGTPATPEKAERADKPDANPPAAPGAPKPRDPGEFVDKQMASVDVIILSTEEDNTDAVGINLLDGLKLQFGNPITQTGAFTRTSTSSTATTSEAASTDPRLSTSSTVITRLIGIPALTYDLNIANANAKRNEVLARPTLVALANQTSTFFSGVDVVGAAVSGGQGSAVQIQKEVGVKMSITPEFLPDDLLKLNVVAERTFLAIPSTSVKFDFRLDTTKTMVNANVVMKFGETLILSGLSERDQTRDRDGTMGLQDVPALKYLFSRSVTRNYTKSILILVTPRRAQYTDRSAAAIDAERAKLGEDDKAMLEFEDKHRPWFRPVPNIGEATRQLERGSFMREFRSGDLIGPASRISSREVGLVAAVKQLFN